MNRTILYLLALLTFSCANVPQIDRGLLSSKIMKVDPKSKERSFLHEVHAYREGSVGVSGQSVGGGCGCN
jgi:hypothetical protein